jgi:2-keto-4-pentenoate hydratase
LANHRAGLGKPLRTGDFVLLGSVTETVFIEESAFVEVDLEGLGKASVELT